MMTLSRSMVALVALFTLAQARLARAQILEEKPLEQSFVLKGRAYVNQWDKNRVTIVDAANPANVVGVWNAPDTVFSTEFQTVAGVSSTFHYLYVVTHAGTQIVDITNPASPVLRSTIAGPADWAKVVGRTAFISESTGNGLVVRSYDVSRPSSPIFLDQQGLAGGIGAMAVVDAAHLAVLTDPGPTILNVASPSNLYIESTVAAAGCVGLVVKAPRLYLACARDAGSSWFHVYDAGAPSAPLLLGSRIVVRPAYTPNSLSIVSRDGGTFVYFNATNGFEEEDLIAVDATAPAAISYRIVPLRDGTGINFQPLDLDPVGQTGYLYAVRPAYGWPLVYQFYVLNLDLSSPGQPFIHSIGAVPINP